MSASEEFTNYVLDLLAPLGAIKSGRFFGGAGLSHAGVQFAMIMGNSLYFVVDDKTRGKYIAENKEPFSYNNKRGEVLVKRYYEIPEDLFEDQEKLLDWANESLGIAIKTSKCKK